jgi:hypothetical protein
MNCWNCGHEVETGTKVCRRCEANQADFQPTNPEDLRKAEETLEQIAPGGLADLMELANKHGTAEGFINAILVGPCAKCGSENVGDCEEDPDHFEPFLGRCFDCGAVWCTECGHVLEKDEQSCPMMPAHLEDLQRLSEQARREMPPEWLSDPDDRDT